MKLTHYAFSVFAALGGLAMAQAHANQDSGGDTVVIPVGSQGPTNMSLPTRGLTQQGVAEQFGEPGQKFAAIGDPPISRWEYGSFTVYFEGNIVIHSVANHTAASAAPAPQ